MVPSELGKDKNKITPDKADPNSKIKIVLFKFKNKENKNQKKEKVVNS